jgi:hypothetical protein
MVVRFWDTVSRAERIVERDAYRSAHNRVRPVIEMWLTSNPNPSDAADLIRANPESWSPIELQAARIELMKHSEVIGGVRQAIAAAHFIHP